MGAVPLFWAMIATASVDDCCSRLSVVSAAAAVGVKAVEHSAEDKQPATPMTNTLLGVFMIVPPKFQTLDEQPACQLENSCERQKAASQAILQRMALCDSVRYFLLCKLEQWVQENAFDLVRGSVCEADGQATRPLHCVVLGE